MKRKICIFIVLALCMTSCGVSEKSSDKNLDEKRTILEFAVFEENADISRQVALFNQSNEEYKIEIQMYERSTQQEEDGVAKLQREIMSGNGPDIIDFGVDYSTSDIASAYTEDLFPYLETTMKQNNEDYFMNILDAFSYKNSLYAIPVSFTLQTFAGSKAALGNREHWNIEEMMTCYQEQDEGMLLYPGQTKTDVFCTILYGSMDYYIDWENGTCSFDGDEFQKVMTFANMFPENLCIADDFSVKQTFLDGGALILSLRFTSIYDICKGEIIFDEGDITYIGFPVEGECGTVIKPSSSILAISIGSKHKDASWEFIEQFLNNQYQSEIEYNLPLSKSALEAKLEKNQTPEYIVDTDGNQKLVTKEAVKFAGEDPVDVYCIPKEQGDRLINLIESATINTATDYSLYKIILEEASSYFSGSKTLEEASEIIQSRATIYVSERVK